jgi:hypothetical protein
MISALKLYRNIGYDLVNLAFQLDEDTLLCIYFSRLP